MEQPQGGGAVRRPIPLALMMAALLSTAAEAQVSHDRPEPGPVESATIAELAERILGAGADTYLRPVESPSGGVLPRWRTGEDGGSRTVTVYFEPPANPAKHGSGYRWAMNQAFDTWTAIAGVALRFREAAGPSTAQVTVRWVTDLPEGRSGITAWETDTDGFIQTAVVTLGLLRADGEPMERRLARQIALHETGHLVGLPHSQDEGDMMFPTSAQSRLSERDRASARLLYAVEPWVLLDGGPEP